MAKRCYNCGVSFLELPKEERTKEHIPAQTFFSGYPIEYRNQRITVPACHNCNQEYSKIDESLRDVIVMINESDLEKSELTISSVKNIFRNKKDLGDRLSFENGELFYITDANILNRLHIKNFKGIFTDIAKEPLSKEYFLDVYSAGDDQEKLKLGLQFWDEIDNWNNWNVSGHRNVFKFKMAYFDEVTGLQEYRNSIPNPDFLICAMQYNNTIKSLVVGMTSNLNREDSLLNL